MPPFRFTRLVVALATALPLALTGCATMTAGATEKSADPAIAAAAQAAAREATTSGAAPAPAAMAPGAARPPAPATTAAAAAAAAAATAAQSQKAFADVIKEAKEYDGFLKLYQKDERFCIELAP